MGQVIAKRYLLTVDGRIATFPFADLASAIDEAETWSVLGCDVRVSCYWSQRLLWCSKVEQSSYA